MPEQLHIATQEEERNHHSTFGEKLFDIGVYGGVGYAANAGISLVTAHYAKNLQGNGFNKVYKDSQYALEKAIGKFKHDQTDITNWAVRINDLAFLSSGGWALLVPMKWMEDRKAQVVGSIDHTFNTGPAYDENHPLNSDIPKQSYLSLFGGRFITYPIIMAVSLPFITTLGGEKAISDGLTKYAGSFFGRFRESKSLTNLASTEMITAGVGAALLYGSSRVIAYVDHVIKKDKQGEIPDTNINEAQHQQSVKQQSLERTMAS